MKLFLELIQVSLGQRDRLSRRPHETEWEKLYAICQQQAVAGLVFPALDKLSKQGQKPPQDMLFDWLGLSEQVKAQNVLMNKEAARLTRIFEDEGHRTAILKGQANARLYKVHTDSAGNVTNTDCTDKTDNNCHTDSTEITDKNSHAESAESTEDVRNTDSTDITDNKSHTESAESTENVRNTDSTDVTDHLALLRQPGDIDIWVDGGREKVIDMLMRTGLIKEAPVFSNVGNTERATASYHHVHLPVNEQGVTVEVHFRPSSGNYNPITNRRLQKWLEREIENRTEVKEGFYVPSTAFALVMQLAHIQRHFMSSGIGMRQVIDYYFLLKSGNNQLIIENGKLKYLELEKMAGAMMWVLGEVMMLDERLMICKPVP